jgi:hypothetical protein
VTRRSLASPPTSTAMTSERVTRLGQPSVPMLIKGRDQLSLFDGDHVIVLGPCDNCGQEIYQRVGGWLSGHRYHTATLNGSCRNGSTTPSAPSGPMAVYNGWRCGNCGCSYRTESERDQCEYHHAS